MQFVNRKFGLGQVVSPLEEEQGKQQGSPSRGKPGRGGVGGPSSSVASEEPCGLAQGYIKIHRWLFRRAQEVSRGRGGGGLHNQHVIISNSFH